MDQLNQLLWELDFLDGVLSKLTVIVFLQLLSPRFGYDITNNNQIGLCESAPRIASRQLQLIHR
jgi:hypothetical protein